ncbi:magnesium transporter [Rhodococcus sp. PvR044]|uniref:magnesium/cobalt transporter CorA n=1 Tax=Rhodococcus TaxID=1827 RepID=UPI000BC75078|nr:MULTISPECIES: magnesium/cobalt transporter CorA [Rhodococcus]MBP1159996.1 magnesium transporter [Rhodococcus sp. PvR099]MCZ4557023.1 magnesium/cobalt transporter CorA [Rhodococcus maanshanensis]PTR41213.1 magnesium transporter [Rhodococcus sp. OK611]SNX92035.1 magnesium transporter [Rhodococcus sp. OK270]
MPSMPSLRPTRRSPGITPARIPVPTARAIVDCAVYIDGERLPGKFTHSAALAEVRARGKGFAWVGLHAPDEYQMGSVAEVFGLHELTVEDAVHAHQRPKLELYDDVLFLVLRTVNYVEHESITTANEVVETGEIMIFLGADFVVTVRHGEHSGLAGVRALMEANPGRLALGPSAVLHAIADHVVDQYLAVTESVEKDVDLMEEEVFSPRTRVPIEQIYLLKREIVELRKSVNPLASPLQRLSQDTTTGVPKEVRRYLRDVQDHHTIVAERIAEFDEVLSTLVEAALAKVAVQQNTDMRKISAWVAIAAVPTMIAGIYGMNFDHMPELRWSYGYYGVVAVIVIACAGLFVTFRRNNWL